MASCSSFRSLSSALRLHCSCRCMNELNAAAAQRCSSAADRSAVPLRGAATAPLRLLQMRLLLRPRAPSAPAPLLAVWLRSSLPGEGTALTPLPGKPAERSTAAAGRSPGAHRPAELDRRTPDRKPDAARPPVTAASAA